MQPKNKTPPPVDNNLYRELNRILEKIFRKGRGSN